MDDFDKYRPKCRGDYRFTDYDEENPPSSLEAIEMCAGCPLMEACNTMANKLRPTHGVWAGRVWEQGERGGRRRRRNR